VPNTYQMNQI
jgi:tRNA A-37 threonylcarbamoyl transferase component Bud32